VLLVLGEPLLSEQHLPFQHDLFVLLEDHAKLLLQGTGRQVVEEAVVVVDHNFLLHRLSHVVFAKVGVVRLELVEDEQSPLLVRLALLSDAKIEVLIFGKGQQVRDDVGLQRRVSHIDGVHILRLWTPVLAGSDSLHVLDAAEGRLVGRHAELVSQARLVEGLLVRHQHLSLLELHLLVPAVEGTEWVLHGKDLVVFENSANEVELLNLWYLLNSKQ